MVQAQTGESRMSQRLFPLFEDSKRVHDFFVDKQTGIIYFLKSVNNRKVKFSTRCKYPDVAKARRVANQEFQKRYGRRKEHLQPLITDELNLWLKTKEHEGLAYDTLNNVRRAKLQIEEFWGGKFPGEITSDNLVSWYQFWREHNSKIEMENAVKYMRNFSRYLATKVVGGKPLLAAVPPIKDPNYKKIRKARKKKKENILTAEDFKKIYHSAESPEHQLIVLFMYTMATRITETLTMAFRHEIHFGRTPEYCWSVGQNKADLEGRHALHPLLIEPLKAIYATRGDYDTILVFPQQKDKSKPLREQMIDWAGWRKRAGVSFHWTPHTFRHTCLSNLFNDEKNPQALICKLYRVSLAVALETYVKPTESGREKMRNAIEVRL